MVMFGSQRNLEPESKMVLSGLTPKRVLVIIILLWAAYTVVYTFYPAHALSPIIELTPGILGVVILIAAGFTPEKCYLRLASISRQGLFILASFFIVLIPILITGRWVGWNWISALIYAPASGIAQGLFFRASPLPFLSVFSGKSLWRLYPCILYSLHFGSCQDFLLGLLQLLHLEPQTIQNKQ